MANLSQQRREKMLAFLETLKAQHSDDESLRAFGEIEKELKSKKYGLVWEEHEEAVDVMMRTHIPVFTEVKEREIVGDPESAQYNFLLEGDNLHSLKLLEKTHRGKIDVIYIDPPYNTGSRDFVYDDAFVDRNDQFAHSKWLSFMSERLRIAHKLLSPNGSIFISIDDNEEAPLKMLCDELFGEECFVANVSWQRTYSIRNDSKGIPVEVEHILIYSNKSEWQPNKLPRTEKMDAAYKNPDGDRCAWMSGSPVAPGAATHQGMVYAIQHPFTGELLYPSMSACWRYSQDRMLEYMNGWCPYELKDLHDAAKRAEICGVTPDDVREGVMGIVLKSSLEESKKLAKQVYDQGPWPRFYFTNGGKGGVRRKVYSDSVGGRIATNYWMYDEVGHTDEAKKELKAVFEGAVPFDTPKPIRLMERIIQIATNDDSIILDFFAGSGSTAHAVIKYNSEHAESHRRFIMCTNNEGMICEKVTYQRIKRVISGYGNDNGLSANLKYFRTDFVDKESEELANELLSHVREMIELEHGVKIDDNKYVIILDEEEMDELTENIADYPDLKAVFISSDILLTGEQSKLLEKTDTYIIPDHYFDFELREAGEIW